MRKAEAPGSPRVVVQRVPGGTRLLVDGTFASFRKTGSVATRSVWDALAAPLLALAPERRRSVLVLGLGGGSAARLVRALAPRARIVGVELDPDVIAAARRHFGLGELGVEIVRGDARAFLERGGDGLGKFDAVIDDVFVGEGRGVRKPAWLPEPGLALAARRVRAGGVLVTNTLDDAPHSRRVLRALLGPVTALSVSGYDNRILAAGARGLCARSLRAAIARDLVLADTLPALTLRTLR
jgi:spermidine synthase